jgi:hypothetical protein
MPMGRSASDWAEEYIIVVPHSWRGDNRRLDIQVETQERIGPTLREMYADLERLLLSPSLLRLIRQIEAGRSAPEAHG